MHGDWKPSYLNNELRITIIGGHGFWDKGGSTPGGDLKKIFRPPSAAEKFFAGAATGGWKIFFGGVFI